MIHLTYNDSLSNLDFGKEYDNLRILRLPRKSCEYCYRHCIFYVIRSSFVCEAHLRTSRLGFSFAVTGY